jgi:hypothetical protein
MAMTSNAHGPMARYCLAAMLLCLLPVLAFAADDAQALLLTIRQDGAVLGTFSLATLEAAGAVTVAIDDDSGQSSAYTGVPIAQLLESVGVALGKSLRGERVAEFIIVRAGDGYRALLSLAETDRNSATGRCRCATGRTAGRCAVMKDFCYWSLSTKNNMLVG